MKWYSWCCVACRYRSRWQAEVKCRRWSQVKHRGRDEWGWCCGKETIHDAGLSLVEHWQYELAALQKKTQLGRSLKSKVGVAAVRVRAYDRSLREPDLRSRKRARVSSTHAPLCSSRTTRWTPCARPKTRVSSEEQKKKDRLLGRRP